MNGFFARAILGLAVICGIPGLAAAQSIWLDRNPSTTLLLEILRPDFEGDEHFSTLTFFASGRFTVSDRVAVVGQVPLANFSVDGGSSFTIGNPYLGLEGRPGNGTVFVEFGIRAPLAQEDEFASITGLLTDVDRWEDFIPNAVCITVAGHHRSTSASGLMTRARIAPQLWIPTEGGDAELFATYTGLIGYENETVRVAGGLGGRILITEGDLDLSERTTHQLELGADFGRGPIRPGASLRVPLDSDLSDALNVVYGVTLGLHP